MKTAVSVLQLFVIFLVAVVCDEIRDYAGSGLLNVPRNLQGVKILNLSRNRITKVEAYDLKSATDLISLDFSYNNLTYIDKNALESTVRLKTLNVSFNNFLSEVGFLLHSTELNTLSMKGIGLTDIPPDSLSSLKELCELYLSKNNLQNIMSKSLIHLDKLNIIDLSENKIEDIGKIFEYSVQLREIYLDRNNLTSLVGTEFSNNKELQLISLNENQLSSVHSNTFTQLQHLKELYMRNNKLSKLSKDIFKENTNLQKLDLSGNNIVHIEVTTFHSQINLQHLYLSENCLKTLPDEIFSNNRQLIKLFLDSNNIEYLYTDIFARNEQLTEINLSNNNFKTLPQGLIRRNSKLGRLILDDNYLLEINKYSPFLYTSSLKYVSILNTNAYLKSPNWTLGMPPFTNIAISGPNIVCHKRPLCSTTEIIMDGGSYKRDCSYQESANSPENGSASHSSCYVLLTAIVLVLSIY
ncbi:leucine-rich repeat-containing protein 15 isoform X2 [Anabrus simplex]